jgi:hypothetical protein
MAKTYRRVCLTLFLAASMFSAEHLAGKWTGSMRVSTTDGHTESVGMALALEQKGSEVTGSLTPAGKAPIEIQNGRIVGERVTFEIQGGNPSLKFDGTLSGAKLTFKVEGTMRAADDGHQFKGTMNLDREQ